MDENFKFSLFLVVPVCLVLLQACAPKKHIMPPLATVEGVKRHFSQGRIIDLETEKAVDFQTLIEKLGAADVIFVGEVHNNPEHHLIQVQLLQALMERYAPPVAVAMEFFDITRQPVLDRLMNGDLDEKTFLKEVGWKRNWRFPYRLYRPLIHVSKEKGSALLGINAPGPVVRKTARSGLQSLTPEERTQVAKDIDLGDRAHREYLEEVFREHTSKDTSPHGLDNFEYFYQAQCVWDETMAETIAGYMKIHGGKMVVFTGNGHIMNRFGIPMRVLRRADVSVATIVLYPLTERTTINKRLADYVWLTSDAKVRMTLTRPMKMPPIKPKSKGKTDP